ncbi:MAG: hypothetical protein ACTHOO_02135 [Alcanivorax sp.]
MNIKVIVFVFACFACCFVFTGAGLAQDSADGINVNQKAFMFLTCINRKPAKPVDRKAAQRCAKTCRPNGKNDAKTNETCIADYMQAMGTDTLPNVEAPKSHDLSGPRDLDPRYKQAH